MFRACIAVDGATAVDGAECNQHGNHGTARITLDVALLPFGC